MLTLENIIEEYGADLQGLWSYDDLLDYFCDLVNHREFETAFEIAAAMQTGAPYYKYDFEVTAIEGASDFIDAFCDEIDVDAIMKKISEGV